VEPVVLPSRSFNRVTHDPDDATVEKFSLTWPAKIQDEIDWYVSLTDGMVKHAPELLDTGFGHSGGRFYRMRYVDAPTVASLDRHATTAVVLDALEVLLAKLHTPCPLMVGGMSRFIATRQMYVDRVRHRLAELDDPTLHAIRTVNGRPVPSIDDITGQTGERLTAIINTAHERWTRIHGDLSFSNMLYDYAQGIIVVDPRGSFGERRSPYGDPAYDLAKLSHCALGLYDRIIDNQYELEWKRYADVVLLFGSAPAMGVWEAFLDNRARRMGLDLRDIRLIEGLSFLACAALHDEDRKQQVALVARGLQIVGWALHYGEQMEEDDD